MFDANIFSRKSVERYLVALCGKGVRQDRKTMDYIRKIAESVESAYKVGWRDGQNGTAPAERDQLPAGASGIPELAQSAVDFAYEAYQAGHMGGAAERGEPN